MTSGVQGLLADHLSPNTSSLCWQDAPPFLGPAPTEGTPLEVRTQGGLRGQEGPSHLHTANLMSPGTRRHGCEGICQPTSASPSMPAPHTKQEAVTLGGLAGLRKTERISPSRAAGETENRVLVPASPHGPGPEPGPLGAGAGPLASAPDGSLHTGVSGTGTLATALSRGTAVRRSLCSRTRPLLSSRVRSAPPPPGSWAGLALLTSSRGEGQPGALGSPVGLTDLWHLPVAPLGVAREAATGRLLQDGRPQSRGCPADRRHSAPATSPAGSRADLPALLTPSGRQPVCEPPTS